MKTIRVQYELWKAIKQIALDTDKTIPEIIKISFEEKFGKIDD